jgi:hypothetical protein
VKALRAAGLDRTCQSAVAQRLANQMSDGDDRGEIVIAGRIQIQNQMRWPIDTFGQT